MVLIISGIILFICVVGFFISAGKMMFPFFFIGFCTILFGFGVFGFAISVETVITIPEDAFIEKNKNSIVLVVPNVGNKLIIDPAIVAYIEVGDTVKVRKDYNSYGFQVENTKIYVEKNGWKY